MISSAFLRAAVFKFISIIIISVMIISISSCGILPTSGNEDQADIYAFINPTDSEHWQQIAAGLEGAAADGSVSVAVFELNLIDDYKNSIEMVKKAVKQSPGAIIIPSVDNEDVDKLLAKAQKKEIPLVFLDSPEAGSLTGTRIYSNNEKAAEKAGHILAELLDGAGEIVILNIAADHPRALEREEGFLTALRDYPEIILLNSFDCSDSRETSKKTLADIMAAHPDITGIFAASPETSAGAVSALTALGKKEGIRIVSFDHPAEILSLMDAGLISAAVGQSPYQIGYTAVEAAAGILKGDQVSDSIDVGFDFVENRIQDSEIPEEGQ